MGGVLYVVHICIMAAFFISGFFISWQWVVGFYLLLELQLAIFDGCSLTKLQQQTGDLSTDEDFIPYLSKKIFRVEITYLQHSLVSFFIMAFPVFVVLIKSIIK
jgi:hypothetical protein